MAKVEYRDDGAVRVSSDDETAVLDYYCRAPIVPREEWVQGNPAGGAPPGSPEDEVLRALQDYMTSPSDPMSSRIADLVETARWERDDAGRSMETGRLLAILATKLEDALAWAEYVERQKSGGGEL